MSPISLMLEGNLISTRLGLAHNDQQWISFTVSGIFNIVKFVQHEIARKQIFSIPLGIYFLMHNLQKRLLLMF